MANSYVDWTQPVNTESLLNQGKVSWWLSGAHAPYWGGDKLRDIIPIFSRGGGNHGNFTNYGSTSPWQSALGRQGGLGSVIGSISAGSYIATTNTLTSTDGKGYTVSVWVRCFTVANNQNIIDFSTGSFGSSDFRLLLIQIMDSPQIRTIISTNTGGLGVIESGARSDIINTWLHVVFTLPTNAGSKGKFYLNGRWVGDTDVNTHAQSYGTYNTCKIANNSDAYVDDICVFDRTLSESEVYALYEDSRRGYPEQLNWLGGTKYYLPASETNSYSLSASSGAYTLTGIASSLINARKLTASAGSYSLAGQLANFFRGIKVVSASGSYVLTGQSSSLLKGPKVTSEAGAYLLTGQSPGLTVTRLMGANAGSYTVSGQALNLLKGFKVSSSAGSYSLSGQEATLTYSGSAAFIAANSGSFSLTGIAASLEMGRVVTATAGSYSLAGQTVILLTGHKVPASSGSYSLSGQAVALKHNSSLAALNGSYTLSGQAANLLLSHLLPVNAGSYSLTGSSVNFPLGKSITASSGSYILTGQLVNLLCGRKVVASTGLYVLTGIDTLNELFGGPFTIEAVSFFSASNQDSLPISFFVAGAEAATGVPL